MIGKHGRVVHSVNLIPISVLCDYLKIMLLLLLWKLLSNCMCNIGSAVCVLGCSLSSTMPKFVPFVNAATKRHGEESIMYRKAQHHKPERQAPQGSNQPQQDIFIIIIISTIFSSRAP